MSRAERVLKGYGGGMTLVDVLLVLLVVLVILAIIRQI